MDQVKTDKYDMTKGATAVPPPRITPPEGRRRQGLLPLVAGVLSLLVLYGVLVLPNRLEAMSPAALLSLPIEGLLLALILTWTSGRGGRRIRRAVAIVLTLLVLMKVGDIGAHVAYARPFNPVIDVGLLDSVFDLLTGAVGPLGAWAIVFGTAVLVIAVAFCASVAVGRAARLLTAHRRTATAAIVVLGGLWAGLAALGSPIASLDAARFVRSHVVAALAGLGDLSAFAQAAAVDRFRDVPGDQLLGALRGKDVLVVFVESYGRTVLDDPVYGPLVRPRLEAGTQALAAAGWGARSAYLASPTVGGISWLAHGTLLSGLWVDNQRRYDSLMVSDRLTLNRAFRNAGWRTVAVMPAITLAWPEGDFFGYDAVHAHSGLGYAGKPFNWVTMPDQYTLSAFDRLERTARPRPPVMAEIALISSHAPWTPIPDLIDWDTIGDGTIFNDQATAGDPPDVVWRDPERVRLQYRRSIDYALDTLMSYILNRGDDDMVLLVLGDHQPAPLVTGPDAPRDVPVHLIAKDPAVLARIAPWAWTEGLLPAPDAPVWGMDTVRDRFLDAFSDPPPRS